MLNKLLLLAAVVFYIQHTVSVFAFLRNIEDLDQVRIFLYLVFVCFVFVDVFFLKKIVRFIDFERYFQF